MDLLTTYKPYFFFHQYEDYFPISVEEYIGTSKMYWKDAVVLNRISIPDLERFEEDTSLISSNVHGEYSDYVPVYGKIDYYPSFIELKYIILFPYSGPIGCCACFGAGQHHGDIEHVTIRLDIVTREITEVYFSAHSGGQWINVKDLEYKSDKQIVVYIARNSHAMYSTPGIKPRLFLCGNDYAETGLKWNPRQVIEINEETDWVKFKGNWGESSPLYSRGWFRDQEDDQHDTFWSRLCFFWTW